MSYAVLFFLAMREIIANAFSNMSVRISIILLSLEHQQTSLHSSAESQLSPRTDCKITIFKRNKKISSELFAKIENNVTALRPLNMHQRSRQHDPQRRWQRIGGSTSMALKEQNQVAILYCF